MSFMERQITAMQTWLKVETTEGTEFLPSDLVGDIETCNDADEQPEDLATIRPYTSGIPQSWEVIKGYGARLSAPGYLDCTEWTVFDTIAAAQTYLSETYPEDDEEDTAD